MYESVREEVFKTVIDLENIYHKALKSLEIASNYPSLAG